MANYAVTNFYTTGTLSAVAIAMKVYIETIVDTKTIRVYTIAPVAGDTFAGLIVHNT